MVAAHAGPMQFECGRPKVLGADRAAQNPTTGCRVIGEPQGSVHFILGGASRLIFSIPSGFRLLFTVADQQLPGVTGYIKL